MSLPSWRSRLQLACTLFGLRKLFPEIFFGLYSHLHHQKLNFNETAVLTLADNEFYPVRTYIGPEHLKMTGGGCRIPFWTLNAYSGDPDANIWLAENYAALPSIPTDGQGSVLSFLYSPSYRMMIPRLTHPSL